MGDGEGRFAQPRGREVASEPYVRKRTHLSWPRYLPKLSPITGGIPMSDEFLVAVEQARELVGELVWIKLSEATRTKIIDEELRLLNADRVARGAARHDHSLALGQSEPVDKRVCQVAWA